jgi:hypothetical protein
VITRRREKDLGLVFEASERLAVNHPIAVPLKRRADGIRRLIAQTPARVTALGSLRSQDLALAIFELLTDVGHRTRDSGFGIRDSKFRIRDGDTVASTATWNDKQPRPADLIEESAPESSSRARAA